MFGSLKGIPRSRSMNEELLFYLGSHLGLSSHGISIWKQVWVNPSAKISLSCLPHFILITLELHHYWVCFQSNLLNIRGLQNKVAFFIVLK